jgi:(1->4)-alpha-D-glucan 1-alpha-D-glucosylmutase
VADRPGATYRLQLHREFGFAAAAGVAGYLAALGVTHAYLSPILQAAPGSMHGYDVVDHSRVSDDLGGEDGFRAMVAALRLHGLGVVVDVVPNHMGIGAPESLNRQFWSVLAEGAGSRYAHWFDIDWAARGGRLLLPILGGPVADCAADLTVDRTGPEPVLRYFEHELPLAPGTAGRPLDDLLSAQHYELTDWRAAATELNWRRFFDVTTLIGVQVQAPDVFAATHHVLLRLYHEGLIDGLRIDHPDGLADPRGYLRRLAETTGGGWVVTEKILTGDEELPADWDCAGTTGYDALGRIGGVFTDPAAAGPLTGEYVRFTGGPGEFEPVAAAARREIAYGSLAAEVSRLARVAARTGDPALTGAAGDDLRAVLAELVCAIGVYRAYVVPGEAPPAESVALLTAAAGQVREQLPGPLHPVLDALRAILLRPEAPARAESSDPAASSDPAEVAARAELAVRFQQTCGPVTAKGVEDTAFYRWSRLIARNEVGGEPGRLALSPAGFHAFATRLAAEWPATMTTLSTHDTKRGEDLRARLAVLAERPGEWAAALADWHERARALGAAPEPDTEYLMWQTLAGAWPIEPDRLTEYLYKAMREAKTRTSWTDQDTAYEEAVAGLARAVLADAGLTGSIAEFVARIEPDARVNSLGAKLVQLTMTGVPDIYQGCELGSFSLVDPDNRRPVDFARRAALLAALDNARPAGPAGSAGPDEAGLDADKLLITSRTLRLRRGHPDWFAGAYEPLAASGPAAGHVLAFARGAAAVTVATRLPAGLARRGGWAGTVLAMPAAPADSDGWRDALTGAVHAGPQLSLEQLTFRLPVALLVPA